ncbi:uncharacterized protein EAF01_007960 [Botrytis porri]|uniref:uncharacterized protein n=1 Tax=Botrytis porri TaxID=87229 RepID=UPI0018FF8814|nr:uncharacterized protein EAF01_007960 [Botrytis porri]KAF7900658.1 hypothetical protein EAF01_007960 [Botrytis porri]
MSFDPQSKARLISDKAESDPNNAKPMTLYITVRSHVFEIPKAIAIQASKRFAKAWIANPTARNISFKVDDIDGEDTDPDPEHFYTVDAIAHLVGYMYGNELGCPTTDVERHSGCLVAWCKVHKFAKFFEMEEAGRRVLERIKMCLRVRRVGEGGSNDGGGEGDLEDDEGGGDG